MKEYDEMKVMQKKRKVNTTKLFLCNQKNWSLCDDWDKVRTS
jgi:hypothetical protein